MADADEDRRVKDAERLVRIEAGIKSLGYSVNQLREESKAHTVEERDRENVLALKIDSIESEMDKIKGGYRMFLKMCAVISFVGAGIWAVSAWVAKQ